jgi:prevent-host-death family protein
MERISHRELRNNSGAILRQVHEGKGFEITNNGVVVAHLVPAQQQSSMQVVRLPDPDFKLSEYVSVKLPAGVSATQLLIDERDGERS